MVQGQIQLNGYSIKDYEGKPLLILLTNEIFRNSIYEELLDVQISVIAEDVNENVIFEISYRKLQYHERFLTVLDTKTTLSEDERLKELKEGLIEWFTVGNRTATGGIGFNTTPKPFLDAQA